MKQYDIDVVVCCYNPNFEQLKKTIISIYKQKNIKSHLIISDDGSRNDYKEKLNSFLEVIKFEDYTLNFIKDNAGTIRSIYSALHFCKTEYVKLISPGDYLFDEYSLYKLYSAITKENADMVFGKQQYYYDEKLFGIMYPDDENLYHTTSNIRKLILKYRSCYVNGASLVYKVKPYKRALEKLIDIGLVLVEDNPSIALMLIDECKIISIPDYIVWYEYGTGVSTSGNNSRVDKDFDIFYRYLAKNNECKKYEGSLGKEKRIDNVKNRFLRVFLKSIIEPDYVIYRLFIKKRLKPSNNTIADMLKITSL